MGTIHRDTAGVILQYLSSDERSGHAIYCRESWSDRCRHVLWMHPESQPSITARRGRSPAFAGWVREIIDA
jgi:hypothetical protein